MGVSYKCSIVYGVSSDDIYRVVDVNEDVTRYNEITGAPYTTILKETKYYICGTQVDEYILGDIDSKLFDDSNLDGIEMVYIDGGKNCIIGIEEIVVSCDFREVEPIENYTKELLEKLTKLFSPYFNENFDQKKLSGLIRTYVVFSCG